MKVNLRTTVWSSGYGVGRKASCARNDAGSSPAVVTLNLSNVANMIFFAHTVMINPLRDQRTSSRDRSDPSNSLLINDLQCHSYSECATHNFGRHSSKYFYSS